MSRVLELKLGVGQVCNCAYKVGLGARVVWV